MCQDIWLIHFFSKALNMWQFVTAQQKPCLPWSAPISPFWCCLFILCLSFQPLPSCSCLLSSYLSSHCHPVHAFSAPIFLATLVLFLLWKHPSWNLCCFYARSFFVCFSVDSGPHSSCLSLELVNKAWLCVWRKEWRVGIGSPRLGQWLAGIAETRIQVLELPPKIFP